MSEKTPLLSSRPEPPAMLWWVYKLFVAASVLCVAAIVIIGMIAEPGIGALAGLVVTIPLALAILVQHQALGRNHMACAGLSMFLYLSVSVGSAYILVVSGLEVFKTGDSQSRLQWMMAAPVGIIIAFVSGWCALLYSRWADRLIVIDQKMPICSNCRYDLQGTLEAKIAICPECGTAIPAHLLKTPL